MEVNEAFWQALEQLTAASCIHFDRPKETAHPRYPEFIYPVDYGYLEGTRSMDGGGIDVWWGSASEQIIDAVICTVDLVKRDSEIKLLIGCTEEEKQIILHFHNGSEKMKGLLIRR